MTKKERLEYYHLVEPKLTALYIDNNFTAPTVEDFLKLSLSAKNREEFLAYFKDKWFTVKQFEGVKTDPAKAKRYKKQMSKVLDEQEQKHLFESPYDRFRELPLPSSSALFQISKSIDIDSFYFKLKNRYTFIAVNRQTGAVAGGHSMSSLSISFKKLTAIIKEGNNDFEIFEIEDHYKFCVLLEKGDFTKISKEKLFENEIYEVPADYPLHKILKEINLYEFADILNRGERLMRYDLRMGWYSSFNNTADFHSFNDTYNKVLISEGAEPIVRKHDLSQVWFYDANPLQIRQEILFGNFKILKRIKIIENIFDFLPNGIV
jgi:hypothetical protein